MRSSTLLAVLGLVCVPMLSVNPAYAQATRTWVSGVGDDANPCSRTAPCKTFAGAISKTAAGGEIDCLDPGGFGTVTITKSITIDCNGTLGSILAAGTNGVNVNGAGINVSLKNLSINGAGTGLIGINFIAGQTLHLDNVTVQNFNSGTANGLRFAPNSPLSFLHVNNSYFWNNGIAGTAGGGIVVFPAVGGSAFATISNTAVEFGHQGIAGDSTNGGINITVRESSIASTRGGGIILNGGASGLSAMVVRNVLNNSNVAGVQANGASTVVRLYENAIFGNTTGVTGNSPNIRSYKNNAINGNVTSDGTGAQELLQ